MKNDFGLTVALVTAASVAVGSTAFGGSQMFPTKRPARGFSAYLISPAQGVESAPDGWTLRTDATFGNSAIADESLETNSNGAICTTTSFPLPKSDYYVSVLVRGRGRVRLSGGKTWKEFKTPRKNYYSWVEVGEIEDTSTVGVEIGSIGGSLNYGGLLAEGQVQPVIPVAKVASKIKAGAPTTVVLLGDSVTENWAGTGGGSSCFEKGNPGLTQRFLEQTSRSQVAYFTHRMPVTWPADRDPARIPIVESGNKTCYDSRIERDTAKRIHLLNLGKGGAASNWGWSRMPDTIIESDYFDAALPKQLRKQSVRFGLAHYTPDLVIVNFGTNDVNAVHPDWLVEDYLFHMRALATNLQQRFGCAVILSTPHKWTRGVHLTSHRQPAMVDALRSYCRATGIALADVYNEYGQGEYDGIHPGDAGHQHIANAYIKTIGGQPSEPRITSQTVAADLKDNGDGTVSDTTTGLVWTRSADLAKGAKHAADTEVFIAQFNSSSTFGHKNWRLPTRDEMLKLVDPAKRKPALPNSSPFESVSGWYRTSTTDWGIDMDHGIPWSSGKAKEKVARIWLVRDVD